MVQNKKMLVHHVQPQLGIFVGHERILVGQSLMANCYLQPWDGQTHMRQVHCETMKDQKTNHKHWLTANEKQLKHSNLFKCGNCF